MSARTLVHALRERAAAAGSSPALWRKQGDSPYRSSSWREVELAASRFGRGLLSLRLPADRPLAAVLPHRPEWLAAELGAMGAGLAVAPLFDCWPARTWVDLLRRLGAGAVLVEGAAQLAALRSVRADLPDLALAIALDAPPERDEWVRSFAEVSALGDGVPEADWTARAEGLDPSGVAAVCATPGTVDSPHLVRHSHSALVAHASRLARATGAGDSDALLSRLSPALLLERAALHLAVVAGAQVYLAPAEGSFLSHLREVRPTFVHGTCDDWEALRLGVEERLEADPPNRKKVLAWARAAAAEAQRLDDDYLPVPGPPLARLKLARTVVFGPLKLALGLQAARCLLVGTGPVRRETLSFFASLDLPLDESWGLAEAGGPVAVNVKGSRRLGAQGRPLPGVAVRIGADGEIHLRTDSACLAAPDGERGAGPDRYGWLHTGDLGELDQDGFLHLAGRKDEQLVIAGRRRVTALSVEARLRSVPLVRHAVCVSDVGEPVALLSLDPERSRRFARDKGLPEDPAQLALDPTLLSQLAHDLVDAQLQASEAERVKRFSVVPGGFCLEEGELTPAGTVVRRVVATRRAGLLASMVARPRD